MSPDDVPALVDEIRNGLSSFAFEDGAPSIDGIDDVAELYGGGHGSHLLPDLVVRWERAPVAPGRGAPLSTA